MTREDVLNDYHVRDGHIVSPGKFEGEMLYVPYFWHLALCGHSDQDDGHTYTFRLSSADRDVFPELPKRRRVLKLSEDSQGFVYEK